MNTIRAAIVLSVSILLAACSQQAFDQFIANMKSGTQALVQLDNALVQVNTTMIDNFIAQQKQLAPYTCGAYNLATTIAQQSGAAAQVNKVISKSVALGLANVAVQDLCAAAGYPGTTVMAASGTPAIAPVPSP
jgi:hypothetical protein